MRTIGRRLGNDHTAIFICIIGGIVQCLHTWYTIFYISRFDDIVAGIQAALAAFFFSMGVIHFTFRAGREHQLSKREDYIGTAKIFAWLEFFINIHYWSKELIYTPYLNNEKQIEDFKTFILNVEFYDWTMAFVFSILFPMILVKYASAIDIKDKADDVISLKAINNKLEKMFNSETEWKVNRVKKVDNKNILYIKPLKQFENKIKNS